MHSAQTDPHQNLEIHRVERASVPRSAEGWVNERNMPDAYQADGDLMPDTQKPIHQFVSRLPHSTRFLLRIGEPQRLVVNKRFGLFASVGTLQCRESVNVNRLLRNDRTFS